MPFAQNLPKDARNRQARRGSRVNWHAPLTIEWTGNSGPVQSEAGFTRVVNSYGCLLVSPREMEIQQRLRLTNLATRAKAEGVVVWKGTQRPDGWELGVELSGTDLNFWGVEI